MAVVWWMWFTLLPGVIHGYENICQLPSVTCRATQSSTRNNLVAAKVVDGSILQDETSCSHTGVGHSNAWVQVDLGNKYHLKYIVIYYRTETYWKPYRFRQYRLYVFNSTGSSQRTLCHEDNTIFPHVPLDKQNIGCEKTARYIRVETTYDAPEDDKSDGSSVILEICEIQVYAIKCNDNCMGGSCDENGKCNLGCNQGYWGESCQENCPVTCSTRQCIRRNGFCYSCPDGYYGNQCQTECSSNCVEQVCDKSTGDCKNGCLTGYYGNDCKQECGNCFFRTCVRNSGYCNLCNAGYYGYKCNTQCSDKCKTQTCTKDNGYCSGCKEGYYGPTCVHQCSNNCFSNSCDQNTGHCTGCNNRFHGSFCNMSCSTNCAQTNCFQHDGGCIGGCRPNWAGNKCNECDSTHYGPDCSRKCHVNCNQDTCNSSNGFCIYGCKGRYYGNFCEKNCSTCPTRCNRISGECEGNCPIGKFGNICNRFCNPKCIDGCNKESGFCDNGCIERHFGKECEKTCGLGCATHCNQSDGHCACKEGWQGVKCDECRSDYYGQLCEQKCSGSCLDGTCFSNNGSCIGGCKGDFSDEKCTQAFSSDPDSFPTIAVGAGLGTGLFVLATIIIAGILLIRMRRKKQNNYHSSTVVFRKEEGFPSVGNKIYSNLESVPVVIEDPEEEPQIENPDDAVYYNELSVAKDVVVADLLRIIRQKEVKKNEGFIKEFKSLPYGERFDCETAKTEENMPKNRFKTTFPYDHSRVVLQTSKDFTSDYINANFIENMEGKREFIACQGPRENTLVDHWRMIWQENVEYIVMLTNLIEGPKVKCHKYWPDEGKELDIDHFSVTSIEEKVYAYFVQRKMTVRKKRVTGSRTVVQYHYTRWPDHGTPNPLNLVVFHRHFRRKIRPSQHPIIVHCSAGIGRTGTFIALDVLSRYGKDKGKVNVIEYVKAMRKDRMTMIQNVDQYMFLYHALYEFFRRKAQYRKREEFLSLYGDMNKTDRQKQLTNEFNELISLKPIYDAQDFKSGKKFSKLNLTKSVLPVEQYLVYLTSHVPGRECYYNAVNVSSFIRADEFISAQLPVPGAATDLVRLLVDHESAFLISLNPLSEVKELQSWVEEKSNNIKFEPYVLSKETQTALSKEIRKTTIKITKKEENKEDHEVQIFECLNWSSNDILPAETSTLTNLIKQFSLDRKSHPQGHITVISKDGATCCGVFCAVYNAIEQLQQDDEVDIFTIVQQLQCRRPEMISTKEEYEFCFKAVSDFLNTDSVYANT